MYLHANSPTSRRALIRASAAALGASWASSAPFGLAAEAAAPTAAEIAVKALYNTLSEEQRKEVCFDWDYRVDIQYGRKPLTMPDPNGVLLRAHVSNAWLITPHLIGSPFYSDEQRALIMEILKAILNPKIDRSLIKTGTPRDDTREPEIRFRDPSLIPGLLVGEMSGDQKEAVQKTLQSLVSPYRREYQDQVLSCLKKQGGMDACRLVFYQQRALADNGEWDIWRLEGPSFVWYFRGSPHVHIWIHVADDPSAPVTSYFG